MVRGNRHAHRNGTHHQHPPDHAHRRQPSNKQPTSKRTQPPSPTPQTRQSKKANGRRNSTTHASPAEPTIKPTTRQNMKPQHKAPSNTTNNSSSHPATSWQPSTTQNSASTYPYATEQANKRSPSAPDTGREHPCRSGEQEPTPSSPHTEALPTNSCSPNSTKPEKAMNSPSPPSVKPSPTKCKSSAPSPQTISLG